jgi:hypothetical protein
MLEDLDYVDAMINVIKQAIINKLYFLVSLGKAVMFCPVEY